ncbi:hypothetical protein [Puniceibacterium confluentis]|uniref:hypothetical protein n=1 Tax=Puniceibacterium confluentis TaxID=1958944 RepID=UPI0011B3A340|nr:hypothetical protein [Puniceibacterium confluentis]
MTHDDDASAKGDLAGFFEAARLGGAEPTGGFMARMEADALRMQPRPMIRRKQSLWRELLQGLGGWPAVAGLTAATCVGVWIGINPPDRLDALLEDPSAIQSVDPLSGYDFAMLEN